MKFAYARASSPGWLVVCGWLAAAAAPACTCGPPREGSVTAPSSSISGSPPPVVPARAARPGSALRLASRAELPLRGERVDAKPNDVVLRHGGLVAVISAKKGRLVDFAPEHGVDELVMFEPTAFMPLAAASFEPPEIDLGTPGVVHVARKLAGKPIDHHAFYFFEEGRLVVESVAAARDERGAIAIALGETASWGNQLTFVDGHGFVTEGGNYAGEYLGAASRGVAYAACADGGRHVAKFAGQELPGFFENPSVAAPPFRLGGGAVSPARRAYLVVAAGGVGDAAVRLPCVAKAGLRRASLRLPELARGAALVVATCASGGRPSRPRLRFPIALGGGPSRAFVEVPEGCIVGRLVAPGHAAGAELPLGEFAAASLPSGALPRAGRLRVRVREASGAARPLPAKVVVRGVPPTPDPDFGVETGSAANVNALYTTGDATVDVPPGRYSVAVHRGPEYDAAVREIGVEDGQVVDVEAALTRVVDTAGWLAADLHVHAMPSSDAPTALADRVRSLAAVGVELAVATDHNAVTDYAPAIREAALGTWLTSLVGDEVTTQGTLLGHYNVFPLAPGSEPLAAEDVTPGEIFREARARAAATERAVPLVVQVNHPRMGDIGYLELLRFDAEDPRAWAKRASLADLDFDTLEVFNGDHYAALDKVERVVADWLALLDAGHRFVATGNSDSHRVVFQEAGFPRTYVEVAADAPDAVEPRAFLTALKQGRAIVTSGPFVMLSGPEGGPGTFVASDATGHVELRVEVRAAPWVDVTKVELLRRRDVVATFDVAPSTEAERFAKTVTVPAKAGDFVVARVRGEKPMTMLHRKNAKPFALTNPIWVR